MTAERPPFSINTDGKQLLRKYFLENGRLDQGFFNNLDGNLPGGFGTKYSELIQTGETYANPGSSQLRQSRPLGDFFSDCEQAIKDAGYGIQEYMNARTEWLKSHREAWTPENRHFFAMLARIYLALRNKGYNDYPDLTA